MNISDEERAEIGEQWAKYFNLKKSNEYNDRYEMEGGTKTGLGVYRTIRDLVRMGGDGFNNEGDREI